MDQRFEKLLDRLEKQVQRMEGGQHQISKPSNVSSHQEAVLAHFDPVLLALAEFKKLSADIGDIVKEQSLLVESSFLAMRHILTIASQAAKPMDSDLMEILKPLNNEISRVNSVKEKNRGSPLFNHVSACAEGIPCCGWVVVTPTPVPFIVDMISAAQFYSNRVIKEFKDKDEKHVSWAKALIKTLESLRSYVKDHHTTGLVWNVNGGNASIY
jgi:adenylyl cyclase-associated protein